MAYRGLSPDLQNECAANPVTGKRYTSFHDLFSKALSISNAIRAFKPSGPSQQAPTPRNAQVPRPNAPACGQGGNTKPTPKPGYGAGGKVRLLPNAVHQQLLKAGACECVV